MIFPSLLLLCSLFCVAQSNEPNLKMGKPAEWEWKLKNVSFEPEANSVQLYSAVSVEFHFINNDFRLDTFVKRRIKILKSEGKDDADIGIVTNFRDNGIGNREEIIGLKVYTFNNNNGVIEKVKAEDNLITTERINKYQVVTKIKPAKVKVGSIIEISYKTLNKDYYNIDTWYAQEHIPTLYTNYDITVPSFFLFNINQTGIDRLEQKSESATVYMNFQNGSSSVNAQKCVFTGKNLHSIKSTDYVYQITDFCDKVGFELNSINIPGSIYKSFTMKWTDIDTYLSADDDFGKLLKRSNPLKDEMKMAGIYNLPTIKEKEDSIFSLLKKKYKWNGEYSFWGRTFHAIDKDGTGSNADLNFILINMLKDAGVNAYPIVMSRRCKGNLPLTHPSISALNTFIVAVATSDSTCDFLDTSMDDNWILATDLCSMRTRLLDGGDGRWIDLSKDAKGSELINITGKISKDAKLMANVQLISQECNVLDVKKAIKNSKDSADYVNTLAKQKDISIVNYERKHRGKSRATYVESIEFTKDMDATDDHIYFTPLLFTPLKDSPFKESKRTLPVEFPNTSNVTINCIYDIPEGYTVEECPQNVRLKNGDNSLDCIVYTVQKGNQIIVKYSFKLTKQIFSCDEYEDLKKFFDDLVSRNKEVIVLKKV